MIKLIKTTTKMTSPFKCETPGEAYEAVAYFESDNYKWFQKPLNDMWREAFLEDKQIFKGEM